MAVTAETLESFDPNLTDAGQVPMNHRFRLGESLTPLQKAFFDKHGFILFANVASQAEIDRLDSEIRGIQDRWMAEGRKVVYGIPLFVGADDAGNPFIQRFAFSSMYSQFIRDFVRDARFEPVRRLVGDNARVGDNEKDGVVINRNLNTAGSQYKRLGWHTDGLRDIFYGRKVKPQLNVGLHFDRCTVQSGGLRLIPGTHNQSTWDMLTKKIPFVSQKADPDEIAVETEPGDLTVHDGRMWHRVEGSNKTGPESLRRTMYVPYLTDAYQPKTEDSPIPSYHRVFRAIKSASKVRYRLEQRLKRA